MIISGNLRGGNLMRKLTALLLTVCILLSFTSCGANTQYGDNVYTVYEGTEYETKIGLALKLENYLINNLNCLLK